MNGILIPDDYGQALALACLVMVDAGRIIDGVTESVPCCARATLAPLNPLRGQIYLAAWIIRGALPPELMEAAAEARRRREESAPP